MNKEEILEGFRLLGLETKKKRDEIKKKSLLSDSDKNKQSEQEVITDNSTQRIESENNA